MTTFERTDAGNAGLVAHLFGEGLRYDHARQRWLLFEGGAHCWREPEGGELVRLALDAAAHRCRAAAEIPGREGDDEAAFARRSRNRANIDNALEVLKAIEPVDAGASPWDTAPHLLAVANGVVDLRTGELRNGRPGDRITRGLDVAYDARATCPRWRQFLDEVFPDDQVREYVRAAVGYSLTAETREQVIFLCHGRGSNGKSTLLAVLRALLGSMAANVPFSALEWEARGNHPADVASIEGARLVTCSEASETARLNEARLKALTGGDAITARRLYGQPFTFRPTAKFWLAVNHLPAVRDDSDGFWRRIRAIPFAREFSEEDRDPRLEGKLLAELPGILAWAVGAAVEWYSNGLTAPEAVRAATGAYREQSDALGAFFAERCVITPAAKVRAADLFAAYRKWAADSGFTERETMSAQAFGRRAGERFLGFRDRQGKHYEGIGLLTSDSTVTDVTDSDGFRSNLLREETIGKSLTGDGYIRHTGSNGRQEAPSLPLAEPSPGAAGLPCSRCGTTAPPERYDLDGCAICARCASPPATEGRCADCGGVIYGTAARCAECAGAAVTAWKETRP